MKQILSTFAMLAMMSSPAIAQKKKTTRAAPVYVAPTPSAPVYSYSGGSSTSSGSGPNFSGAVSLGSVGGLFMFGPTLKAEWPTMMDGNDMAFGGQTGIYFGSNAWLIPIMITGKYHFQASGMIKPYLGLGLGITLFHVSTPSTVLGVAVPSVSATSTNFAAMIAPGMNFGDEGKFFAELPFGTMGSSFAILPSFGMHF